MAFVFNFVFVFILLVFNFKFHYGTSRPPYYRNKRIKGNTQKWFDSEVLEKLNARDKLFKKVKKSRLNIDKELYKKAKYDASKLITTKKQAFFKEKLSETIGKPKALWNLLSL